VGTDRNAWRPWRRGQDFPSDEFEVLCVMPRTYPSFERAAIEALLPHDRLIESENSHDMAMCVEGAALAKGDALFFTEQPTSASQTRQAPSPAFIQLRPLPAGSFAGPKLRPSPRSGCRRGRCVCDLTALPPRRSKGKVIFFFNGKPVPQRKEKVWGNEIELRGQVPEGRRVASVVDLRAAYRAWNTVVSVCPSSVSASSNAWSRTSLPG
jgi:hypothetical protein